MGLIQTWCLATEKLLNNLSDFSFIDRWVNLWVLSLFLLYGRRVRGIDLILKVFLPPPDNTPRLSQQLPTCSVNCTGNALLPPSEVLNGSSKVLCGQMRVHIYGLNSSQTKTFCPWNRPSLQYTWHASTYQQPQESHKPTRLNRIPSSAWWH